MDGKPVRNDNIDLMAENNNTLQTDRQRESKWDEYQHWQDRSKAMIAPSDMGEQRFIWTVSQRMRLNTFIQDSCGVSGVNPNLNPNPRLAHSLNKEHSDCLRLPRYNIFAVPGQGLSRDKKQTIIKLFDMTLPKTSLQGYVEGLRQSKRRKTG